MELDTMKVFGTDDYEELQSRYEEMCHGAHRLLPEDFELNESEDLYYKLMSVAEMDDSDFLNWLRLIMDLKINGER